MTNAVRAWDLSTGRAVSYRGPRPAEIPIATALSPDSIAAPPAGGKPEDTVMGYIVNLDVWGMGRMLRIEESHFFKRSAWYSAAKAGGYDPGDMTNQEGHGYIVSVIAMVMVKDADGAPHVVGAMSPDVFLNGGTAPDGTEPITGAQGIRFQFTVSLANLEEAADTIPAWDLVAYVEAIPEARIGCGDVVDAHVGNLYLDKPVPLLFVPTGWGP